MARNNKTYGFTIAVKELKETVPNLFRYASAYKRTNNLTSKGMWEMFLEPEEKPNEQTKLDKLPEEVLKLDPNSGKLPDVDPESMETEKYNMCHFWSNFEIARLDFFRSKPYEDFFQMMDKSGGFWTERVSIHRSTHTIFPPWLVANNLHSGEMLRSIPLPLVPSLVPQIFTISVILATDTPPFSTVPPMLPPGNYPDRNSSRRQLLIPRKPKRRMTIGKTGMRRERMAWGVGADATQTSKMSKANREVVLPSGWG